MIKRDNPPTPPVHSGPAIVSPCAAFLRPKAVTALYGIQSFPTQIIIDRDGKVVGRRGKGNGDQLIKMLEEKK